MSLLSTLRSATSDLDWRSIAGLSVASVLVYFDVFWFTRLAYVKLASFFRPAITLGEEGVQHSVCITTDLDFYFHMNNSRYLREMDFGR